LTSVRVDDALVVGIDALGDVGGAGAFRCAGGGRCTGDRFIVP